MTKMPDTAKLLTKRLSGTVGEKPAPVADAFSQAIGKQLEDKGIANVPGLPRQAEPEWFDKFIAYHDHMDQFEREREQQRVDEREESESATSIIHRLFSGSVEQPAPERRSRTAPVALNSDALVNDALAILQGRNE